MQEDNVSFTANNWPEDRWPNFAHRELACSETGECEMDEAFMGRLQLLRNHYGHALRITSGYRRPAHSIEAAKPAPAGTHAKGRAVDIACAGVDAFQLEFTSATLPTIPAKADTDNKAMVSARWIIL